MVKQLVSVKSRQIYNGKLEQKIQFNRKFRLINPGFYRLHLAAICSSYALSFLKKVSISALASSAITPRITSVLAWSSGVLTSE